MKRVLIILSLLFLFGQSYSQNITDGNLDNWERHDYGAGTYYEPLNGWLKTLNKLADVPEPIGPGPVTTEKSTEYYLGFFAAKLISKEFFAGVSIFIPGTIGTIDVDIATQSLKLGRPYSYTEKPRRFKGYYKYAPVNNDSCLMLTLITKYNTTLHQRDTIAIGRLTGKVTVSTYTPFDIEIIYKDTITQPDSITVIIASSAFLNFANLQACHGQINSTMYVDELSFSMVNGIAMPVIPAVTFNVFPNPAIGHINFSSGKPLKSCNIEIYDSRGRLVKIIPYEGFLLTENVSEFPTGKYYYKLSDKKNLLNSGSFIVGKR